MPTMDMVGYDAVVHAAEYLEYATAYGLKHGKTLDVAATMDAMSDILEAEMRTQRGIGVSITVMPDEGHAEVWNGNRACDVECYITVADLWDDIDFRTAPRAARWLKD